MMAAHVEEPAQHAIATAHHHDRFATDLRGHEPAGLGDLRGTADQLPGPAPHRAALERRDARVGVPLGRDRRGLVERRRVVEPGQDGFEGVVHSLL
jgi:hypothetical protein